MSQSHRDALTWVEQAYSASKCEQGFDDKVVMMIGWRLSEERGGWRHDGQSLRTSESVYRAVRTPSLLNRYSYPPPASAAWEQLVEAV